MQVENCKKKFFDRWNKFARDLVYIIEYDVAAWMLKDAREFNGMIDKYLSRFVVFLPPQNP